MEGILYCRQGGRAVAGAGGVGQFAKKGVPDCGPCRGIVGSISFSSKFMVAAHSQPVSPVRFSTWPWEPNGSQTSLASCSSPDLLVVSLQVSWFPSPLTSESLALSSLLAAWSRSHQAGHPKVKCGFLGEWLCSRDHC